jgi:hypothetical protein
VKHVAPWAEPAALAEGQAPEMMADVALFEPNQRGRRAFDRFLSGKGRCLGAPDFALAERMAAGAAFSIFRFAGRHEVAGLWLEDMLQRPPPPLAGRSIVGAERAGRRGLRHAALRGGGVPRRLRHCRAD